MDIWLGVLCKFIPPGTRDVGVVGEPRSLFGGVGDTGPEVFDIFLCLPEDCLLNLSGLGGSELT